MSNLAIVIPFYKVKYFEDTLKSICNQTCKDFVLYIGDDCSPDDISPILNKYKNEIDVVYKRFDNNIGSENLVYQWNRCVDLVQDEEWVWLFSDDDLMDRNCVKEFYNALKKTNKSFDIYGFTPIKFKNNLENLNPPLKSYQEYQDQYEFIINLLNLSYRAHGTNFIFLRKLLNETGGFINFPLAWGSDLASWVKFAKKGTFYSMQNSNVYFRTSVEQLSGIKYVEEKIDAYILFCKWINNPINYSDKYSEKQKLEIRNLSKLWFKKRIRINKRVSFATFYKYLKDVSHCSSESQIKLLIDYSIRRFKYILIKK